MYNFPDNPAVGDMVTIPSGVTYIWDGVKWKQVRSGDTGGGGGGGGPGTTYVNSFNTRHGDVTLSREDILDAGGAPIMDPTFAGIPKAPTAPTGTNNTQLATTEFVAIAVGTGGGTGGGGGVPDAPNDGPIYGRGGGTDMILSWQRVIAADGDTVDGGNFISRRGMF
jgi:hypothetical protein